MVDLTLIAVVTVVALALLALVVLCTYFIWESLRAKKEEVEE